MTQYNLEKHARAAYHDAWNRAESGNYVVLYRIESILSPLDAPLGFQCCADDADHAEEQCINAYPDADVVWVWQGPEGVGMEPALQDYWGN